MCHQDQSSQRVFLFCFCLCFLILAEKHLKKQRNMLQNRTKVSQADFCLARMEKYFNKLSFPPDFSSCHFFSNTLSHCQNYYPLWSLFYPLFEGKKITEILGSFLLIMLSAEPPADTCAHQSVQKYLYVWDRKMHYPCGLRFYLFKFCFVFKCKYYLIYFFLFSISLFQMKYLTALSTSEPALLGASVSVVAGNAVTNHWLLQGQQQTPGQVSSHR